MARAIGIATQVATQRACFAAHTLTLPLLLFDRKSWLPSRRTMHAYTLGTAVASAATYWACDLVLSRPIPKVAQVAGQVALCLLLVQASPQPPH